MGKKISIKQQKFIDAYIELGNATEAAKRAGYKCKSYSAYASVGAENLKKLAHFINERLHELKKEKTADLTEILEFLTSVLRGEITETVFYPISGEREDIRANVRSRVDAAKELLKRYPRRLDEEHQRLLLEKLRAEIKDMKSDVSEQQVVILDDIRDALEAEKIGDGHDKNQ